MDLNLNDLDRGISRFLEHSLKIILKQRPGLDEFQSAAQTLLIHWPVLGSRLNISRTGLIAPAQQVRASAIWQGREVDRSVNEFCPLPTCKDSVQIFDSELLDGLVNYGFGFPQVLRPTVVAIRTVLLRDGCVLGFKVQHPFGDATAIVRIAQAYCALLDGKTPPCISPIRLPMKLKSDIEVKAEAYNTIGKPHPIATLHSRVLRASWPAFLNVARRQTLRNLVHPSSRRVTRSLFIPREHIQRWVDEARKQGVRVTEHDLVVAWAYQAARKPSTAQDFGIILNIQRELELEVPFANPWVFIPIPSHPDQITSPEPQNGLTSLVDMATHVRRTIISARDPGCISQIIDQHSKSNYRPFSLRYYGTRASQLTVSSWAKQSLFDLGFRGGRPLYSQAGVAICGIMDLLGFAMDDVLVVCMADHAEENEQQGGYWVHGNLENSVWKKMAEAVE